MEYSSQGDYERRIAIVHEITTQHPKLMRALTDHDRELLERYFLAAWDKKDRAGYRNRLLKRQPTIELQANKAYERFLAEAGLPETLPKQA